MLRPIFLALGALSLSMVACGSDVSDDAATSSPQEADLLKMTGPTSNWSYRGLMPELIAPEITVSMRGHTVHVTGLLRPGHPRLPFYAQSEELPDGNTRVHLVYPMATANTNSILQDGVSNARNPEPFDYKVCGGDNFHPTNEIGAFGGFPFIEYVCWHRRANGQVDDGIAFHGPISSASADGATYWALLRGPVSHGCNRMLGEHILELAHVIGFDHGIKGTKVHVLADFDHLGDRIVDVEYPSYMWQRPPANESVIFPIWRAVRIDANGHTKLDFPQWACETERCDSMPPNARDPYTGDPL